MTGRERCDRLKRIRKGLADRLGVDLHQVECTYEGECRGTCPKCKQEEEILNRALFQRGTAVAGATMLATSLAACTPPGQPISSGGDLSGDIEYIDEPEPNSDTKGKDSAKGDDGKGGGEVVELSGEVDEKSLQEGRKEPEGKPEKTPPTDVPDDLTGYVG